jgi:hypothetical protein
VLEYIMIKLVEIASQRSVVTSIATVRLYLTRFPTRCGKLADQIGMASSANYRR